MTPIEAPPAKRPFPRPLIALLVVSYCLRVRLAIGGGQGFWPDETRYDSARAAAGNLAHGQWMSALTELFAHSDHVLFRAAGLPAALLEYFLGGQHPALVSCYFAFFSVWAIYLIWAIARRAGAPEEEALWAAFLAAASNSLYYYSRHFFPYDIALCGMLAALWLALGPYSARNSFWAGCMAAISFMTYNGYWLLGGCVLTLHTVLGNGGGRRFLMRGVCSGAGLILTIVAVVGVGRALSGDLLTSYFLFSGTVLQGDFFAGYRVIPEYLWYSERGVLPVWLAALAYAAGTAARARVLGRLGWWLGGIALLSGGLILFSDVIPRLVVYGRLSRGLVPFLCLGAGMGVFRFLDSRHYGRGLWSAGIFAVVACLAAMNFAVPLRQVFPDEFLRLAGRKISFSARHAYVFHRVLFAGSMWGARLDLDLPPHTELMRRAQPMQFRPYQFEGFSAEQRAGLNSHDIAMQLIEVPPVLVESGRQWEGYPGPVRMKVTFNAKDWPVSEPLVVSGKIGAGDFVFVRYLDADHIAFGVDHWGVGEILSKPVQVDLGRPHELVVSAGSLVPPPGSGTYRAFPELAELCGQIVVILDGHLVFSSREDFYPSDPATIFFGVNPLGGTSTRPDFTGSVSEFASAPIDQIALAVPSMAPPFLARKRSAEWKGALGPVRLRFIMEPPLAGKPVPQPLLSVNGANERDLLFIVREGTDRVRIGLDRPGEGAVVSDSLNLDPTGVEQLDVSLGALLPEDDAPIFRRVPNFVRMRGRVYVRFNDEPVLLTNMRFVPVAANRVDFGANTANSTAGSAYFKGNILSVESIGPENIPSFGTHLPDLLGNPDKSWSGFPGPIKLRVVFPTGRAGMADPLLVSGVWGSADVLYVRYDSDSQVRFGYEHSGSRGILSAPIAVEPGATQELLMSTGALMPPAGSGLYLKTPELSVLESTIQVGINGRPALFEYEVPHPTGLDQVIIGANPLGGAATGPEFQGELKALVRARPLERLQENRLDARLARPGWGGYPGPLQMRIVFPEPSPGPGQPILTTGLPGGGDFIFVQYGSDGMLRIGQDHWGSPLTLSEPFVAAVGSVHTLAVSFGALFPPPDSPIYRREPELSDLRMRVVVVLDGRRILSAGQLSHPTSPEQIILGANFIGGSSARPIFSGEITDVKPAPIAAVAP